MNRIDPSGKMSLPEKLITVGIVGNLAMMGLGMTEEGQNVMYPFLAKHIYPEAYIVGFNVAGIMHSLLFYELFEFIYPLFGQSPVSNSWFQRIKDSFTVLGSNTSVGGVENLS